MKTNYQPLIRFILLAILSAFISYFAQPLIHNNEKANDLLINVFAILAGFLISIMTLFGDIKFDENANWRQLRVEEDLQNQRYTKHSFLFYSYLSTLILIFSSILLKNKETEYLKIMQYLEYMYLWLACISIFYSFFLPNKLIQHRKEEYKKIMESKKPKKLD